MEYDFENELLNLSNNQRDILDEYDDNLKRLKTTYINTLIEIQHSLNELQKKEFETRINYDNYQQTITELLDTPYDFSSNMDRLNNVITPTYNNTFGTYNDININNLTDESANTGPHTYPNRTYSIDLKWKFM